MQLLQSQACLAGPLRLLQARAPPIRAARWFRPHPGSGPFHAPYHAPAVRCVTAAFQYAAGPVPLGQKAHRAALANAAISLKRSPLLRAAAAVWFLGLRGPWTLCALRPRRWRLRGCVLSIPDPRPDVGHLPLSSVETATGLRRGAIVHQSHDSVPLDGLGASIGPVDWPAVQ